MGVVFPNGPRRSSAPSPSQKPCAFVTWSDWDLGVCLQYECKRKQLHKPDVLNSWIDLRSTYRLFYDRKPKGLNGALQDLGIQFSGREHSGLDDSRNTAQLAARMMRDGCVMKITRSLEKMPLKVKPPNTTADNRKPDRVKGENAPSANKPPPPPIKSCSEDACRDLDPRRNSSPAPMCRSLISPKTLLNGTTTPLWGRSGTSVRAAAVANVSAPVMVSCPSPRGDVNRSLLLCSTTLGCVSNPPRPNQQRDTEATREEELCVEPEERWGSYDDVVLQADDEDVVGETGREFVEVDYGADFDSGCRVGEKANEAPSFGDEVTRDNVSGEDDFKTGCPSASIALNKIRQHSTIPEPSTYFVEPKAVSWDSDQRKTGLVISRQIQENRDGPHRVALLRHFIPAKTSTPHTSFARPKAFATNHRETPKSSFAIFADPAKPSSAGSLCSSKKVLSSLSTNALPSVCATATGGQRITSPLCACGRRAKRQLVSNGGPNQGRGFYCCPVRRSGGGGGQIQKGCEFFKWESALMKSGSAPAWGSSVSLCVMTPASGRPPQRSAVRKSC
ncbi:ERI1 exoribonuclease 2 isoform X2 [Gasterosteus aculeatus]